MTVTAPAGNERLDDAGERYPVAARRVAEYIARRAFATSVIAHNLDFESIDNPTSVVVLSSARSRSPGN